MAGIERMERLPASVANCPQCRRALSHVETGRRCDGPKPGAEGPTRWVALLHRVECARCRWRTADFAQLGDALAMVRRGLVHSLAPAVELVAPTKRRQA